MTLGPPSSIIRSADGTAIAYRASGEGPPLVLVHGTTADSTRWAPLLPHLEPYATLYAIDRRGRGGSGDSESYDARREFEDVAAVVDALFDEHGSAVSVYGHSYGALCALGGAALTENAGRLVLYEPVVSGSEKLSADLADRMDETLARGEREQVVEMLFAEVLGMSGDELAGFKSAPSWAGRIAAAHTVPRETRAEHGSAFSSIDTSRVTVPTLMLVGENSPGWLRADTDRVAAVLPDARIVVLEGQEHVADVLVPEMVAGHIVRFLRGEGD